MHRRPLKVRDQLRRGHHRKNQTGVTPKRKTPKGTQREDKIDKSEIWRTLFNLGIQIQVSARIDVCNLLEMEVGWPRGPPKPS